MGKLKKLKGCISICGEEYLKHATEESVADG